MPQYVYEARTSKGIATEMCRYDEATITSTTIIREAPQFAIDSGDQIEIDRFRRYQFTIKGPYKPTVERWKSFGVAVQNLREE